MSKNKQPTEYMAEPVSTYQTGSTSPPKSHGGVVAVILSVTILICGIFTIFSLMRINLLQKVTIQTQTQSCEMAFAETTQPATAQVLEKTMPIRGQTLDPFWQAYQDLPQGIYVTERSGPLQAGDIIVSIGDTPVTNWESLLLQIARYQPGDPISITVYRNNQLLRLEFAIFK